MAATLLEAKADNLESRVTALERSLGGLAIGGADGSGGDSKADLAALRELLLAAKQEHDALAKAKAQAEERTERLEYRVSMLVASLREADKALGKPAPPPMPQRRPTAAAAAPAADEDEDEAAVA